MASFVRPEDFEVFKQKLYSTDIADRVAGAKYFRVLLVESNDSIADASKFIFDIGIVPRIVEFLDVRDNSDLRNEASWSIANIASGINGKLLDDLLELDVVAKMFDILKSDNEELQENALLTLGNIAGENKDYRMDLIQQDAFKHVFECVRKPILRISKYGAAASLITNLLKEHTELMNEASDLRNSIQFLASVLYQNVHELKCTVRDISDALWGFSYVADYGPGIGMIRNRGIIPTILKIFRDYDDKTIKYPTIRLIGSMLSGTDDETEYMIRQGCIPILVAGLNGPDDLKLHKEILWSLSNISAGTTAQIQLIVQNKVVEKCLELLKEGYQHDFAPEDKYTPVKMREAMYVLLNVFCTGNSAHQEYMLNLRTFHEISVFLKKIYDPKTHEVLLELYEFYLNLMKEKKKLGATIDEMASNHTLEYFERLANHEDTNIYKRATKILNYFGEEIDEEEEGTNNNEATGAAAGVGVNNENPDEEAEVADEGNDEEEEDDEEEWEDVDGDDDEDEEGGEEEGGEEEEDRDFEQDIALIDDVITKREALEQFFEEVVAERFKEK